MSINTCGYPFIYDGVPSELYGLSMLFVETDKQNVPSGSGFTIDMDQVENAAGFHYLGERQDICMEFPVEILCKRTMDVLKQTRVKDWLFGGQGWKHLQICIPHQNTFYYNCRFQPMQDLNYYGYDGFRCTVQCDSPYAYEFWRTKEYRYTGNTHNAIFNNRSEDLDYLKPIVECKVKGTAFSVKNKSDGDRLFSFTGLQANETLKVDCRNCFIESSTGLIRLDNFNGKFFRLVKGINELVFTGQTEWVRLHYQNLKRLGGGFG